MIAALASLVLAIAPPLGAGQPTLMAKQTGEEFLWRSGYWYCGHFRNGAAGMTVHRSEAVEGTILQSASGSIAALPEAFAQYLGGQSPELVPIRAGEVRCFRHPAKRNLKALIDRESGLGASVMTYRGQRTSKVTRSVTVVGFAAAAEAALQAWRPPAGSTIYRP